MFIALEQRGPRRPSPSSSTIPDHSQMNYFQITADGQEELYIRPTKADWERLRPFICDSYRKQHTVRQIREALIARGYGVSERMLKGRLAKWNMNHKNNTFKPHHVKAVIRKSEECLEQGKTPPTYVIHGRKRTYDDAVRLLCRWKKTEVVQRPSLPSPPSSDPEDVVEIAWPAEESAQERMLIFPMSDSVPRSPCYSPEQARTSRTLSSVRSWYDGYGTALLHKEQWHHCCTIYSLLENCQTAMQSAQTYGVKSQWNTLHDLALQTRQSVNNLSTSSFLNALRWLTLFKLDTSQGPISNVVMNILSTVAAAQLGSSHPIALLFDSAARTPITSDLVRQLWTITRETVVTQTSGPEHDDFLGHSLVRIGAVMANLGAYNLADGYLREGEDVGSRDYKVLGCARWQIGRLRRLQGRIDGSGGAIEVLESHALFLREREMEDTFLGLSVQDELGRCYADLQQWDRAAYYFAEAIRFLDKYKSGKLSRKVGLIHARHDALVNAGQTVEAFALQSQFPEAFKIDD